MHILDEIGRRHAAEVARAREEGYQAGHKEGLREGYASRVKDEVAARWHGTIRAREFNDQEEERND